MDSDDSSGFCLYAYVWVGRKTAINICVHGNCVECGPNDCPCRLDEQYCVDNVCNRNKQGRVSCKELCADTGETCTVAPHFCGTNLCTLETVLSVVWKMTR